MLEDLEAGIRIGLDRDDNERGDDGSGGGGAPAVPAERGLRDLLREFVPVLVMTLDFDLDREPGWKL